MKKVKKLFSVDFKPMWPVGCSLIIIADDLIEAEKIASETIKHTKEFKIDEVDMAQSKVVIYQSGDY